MMVMMAVVYGADILQLVRRAALRAALNGTPAGDGEPDGNVGVDGTAGAADVLLVAEALDHDRVVEGTYAVWFSISCPDVESCVASCIPLRLASNGRMSKISTPCILPKISNRSRPVACSMSVGMVPGAAPGGRRSASDVTSARHKVLAYCFVRLRYHANGAKPTHLQTASFPIATSQTAGRGRGSHLSLRWRLVVWLNGGGREPRERSCRRTAAGGDGEGAAGDGGAEEGSRPA